MRQCRYVLKLTGRYAITSDIARSMRECSQPGERSGWWLAVQNPRWRKMLPTEMSPDWPGRNGSSRVRQETQAIGFRAEADFVDHLFGWWRQKEMCQECHMTEEVNHLRAKIGEGKLPRSALCDLPPLDVVPVREGSTGQVLTDI